MKKVEAKIDIQSTAEKVMSAFIDPKMLNGWWGVEKHLIELKNGGIYSLAWNVSKDGIGFVSTGIIKEYIPNEKLMIENFVYLNPEKSILGPMSLIISTRSENDRTELHICQDGYQSGEDWDWYYNAVLDAWPKALETIKGFIENTAHNKT